MNNLVNPISIFLAVSPTPSSATASPDPCEPLFTPSCSYWDEEMLSWKSDGCLQIEQTALIENREHIECQCSHLTIFALTLRASKRAAGGAENECSSDNLLVEDDFALLLEETEGLWASFAVANLALASLGSVQLFRMRCCYFEKVPVICHLFVTLGSCFTALQCLIYWTQSSLRDEKMQMLLLLASSLPLPLGCAVLALVLHSMLRLLSLHGRQGSSCWNEAKLVALCLFALVQAGIVIAIGVRDSSVGADLALLGTVLTSVFVVAQAVAFLIFGLRLRSRLSKFKSKHLGTILFFSASFAAALLLQCAVHLVSLLGKELFRDHFTLIQCMYFLLQLASTMLVLLIFRRKVCFAFCMATS